MSRNCQLVDSEVIEGLMVRGYDRDSFENIVSLPKTYTRRIMPANRSHVPTREKIKHTSKLSFLSNILTGELDIPIALLIGYNCARVLKPLDVVSSESEGLFAQKSVLGWGIVGFVDSSSCMLDALGLSHFCTSYSVKSPAVNGTNHISSICFRTTVKEVFSPLDCAKLLEQDFRSTDTETPYSVEDTRFLAIVNSRIRQQEDGHYVLPLPFKNVDRPVLPCNSRVALQRLGKLKSKFMRDKKYFHDYCKVIDKLLSQGHASLVLPNSSMNNLGHTWYLPHHGVYHLRKKDKLRVVFDGSSRYQGASLNERLLTGPDLINSLTGILLRFRKEIVAFSVDIAEMFHQFVVDETYRDYLRFYWYINNDISQKPSVFRMNRHIFGSTSSPG